MKKKQAKLKTAVFLSILILPGLVWLLLKPFGLADKLDFETTENRKKHEIKKDVTADELTAEIEAWYNDRVPFRSVILSADRGLNRVVELPYKGAVEPLLLKIANRKRQSAQNIESSTEGAETRDGTDTKQESGEPQDSEKSAQQDGTAHSEETAIPVETAVPEGTDNSGETTVSDETTLPEETTAHVHEYLPAEHLDADFEHYGYTVYRCSCGDEYRETFEKLIDDSFFPTNVTNKLVEGRYGWLFLEDEFKDITGSNLPVDWELSYYASWYQRIYNACTARGTQVYAICLPNKSRIYPEYLPTVYQSPTFRMQQISDYMAANSSVPFSFVYGELLEKKPEHDLYYKLDTHWNYHGTLIGLNVLKRMMGLPEVTYNDVRIEQEEHRGDLPNLVGEIRYETADKLIYKPEVTAQTTRVSEDGYKGFFDRGYIEYYSDAADGRTLVILGDSFQVSLSEFLCKDFKHTYFINRDKIGSVDPQIMRTADILVIECLERNTNDLLLNQATGFERITALLE